MKEDRNLQATTGWVVALLAAWALTAAAPGARAASTPLRIENVELETRVAGQSLESDVRDLARTGDTLWVGYAATARAGDFNMCCGSHWKSRRTLGVCHLENRRRGFVFSENDVPRVHLEGDPDPELHVLMRLSGGRVDRIEAFTKGCPLDAGGQRLVWLDGAVSRQSVEMLDSLITGGGSLEFTDRDNRDEAMSALAFHVDNSVTPALERHARTADDDDLREEAIFWLGEARERPGYQALMRLARDLSDSDLREHITFALSQSPVPEAEDALIDMARNDRDPEVRGQALFWLGQEGGRRAAEAILEAVRNDPDEDVREEAVFALSELPGDDGVETLLKIARDGSFPTDVRKEALFWLGQSDDPRALDLLADLLR